MNGTSCYFVILNLSNFLNSLSSLIRSQSPRSLSGRSWPEPDTMSASGSDKLQRVSGVMDENWYSLLSEIVED
jgi:hypothetical protein